MLLGTLGASLLGNLWKGKGVIRDGKGTIRTGERTIGAGQDFWCCRIPKLILKYKSIIEMNLNLIEFTQVIIYLK